MGQKRPSTGSMSARATANLMLEAKNTRKRAEADVHLLANRLAHLQVEEEKARRKTEEIRLVREGGRYVVLKGTEGYRMPPATDLRILFEYTIPGMS